MNTYLKARLLASALTISLCSTFSYSNENDGHDKHHSEATHHLLKAPNGGRIVASVDPALEVFVTEDRNVEITFLDEEGTVLPPNEQTVSLVGGDRSSPTRLSFFKRDGKLVSDGSLPDENGIPIILSIKENPDAATVRERFNLNMSTCPECELAEYACICGHEEGAH